MLKRVCHHRPSLSLPKCLGQKQEGGLGLDTSVPGGGNNGGKDWGHGGNGNNDDDDFFGAWLVVFLAGVPFAVDGIRRLSYGKEGVRILQLHAEPGTTKPLFAAMAMGRVAVKTPSARPDSMSDGGSTGLVGVLTLLLLCAGGYIIYSEYKKRRPSGPAQTGDEDLEINAVDPSNIATRALDPSMFQTQPPSQMGTGTVPANPFLGALADKDSMFGGPSPGIDGMPSQSPAAAGANQNVPAAPPVAHVAKQLPPDEVVVLHPPVHDDVVMQDTREGNVHLEDLPSKDDFFGRTQPAEVVSVPSPAQSGEQAAVAAVEKAPANLLLEDGLAKDAFFGANDENVDKIDVIPHKLGSVAVPTTPSPIVVANGIPQPLPSEVVQVHAAKTLPGVPPEDLKKENVLEQDFVAKESFFGKAAISAVPSGGESTVVKDAVQVPEENSAQNGKSLSTDPPAHADEADPTKDAAPGSSQSKEVPSEAQPMDPENPVVQPPQSGAPPDISSADIDMGEDDGEGEDGGHVDAVQDHHEANGKEVKESNQSRSSTESQSRKNGGRKRARKRGKKDKHKKTQMR